MPIPFTLRRLGRAAGLCLLPAATLAQTPAPTAITVQVRQPGATVASTMFGLFFEDINFSADGGLYPELVKNKSFELPEPLLGWRALRGGEALATYAVRTEQPAPGSAHYLRLTAPAASPDAGVGNEGFRGMGLRQGDAYCLTLLARAGSPAPRALRVVLETDKGAPLAEATLPLACSGWQPLQAELRPTATTANGRLKLLLDGPGTVDVDQVSLYPRATWQSRPNGLRPDLVQLLHDLKPGFLRFPGGCIVEGRTLATRYQWKKTIGDVALREPLINRWNTEFTHRFTPDYYQSFGLGFYEYFQLAEDLGAEPLPILNVGMACQYNSAELAPLGSAAGPKGPNAAPHDHATDDPTLDTFIQDALDLVEFANGPASSYWGAKRVAMGHPAPFYLRYLGVGNEQWGPQYLERYVPFARALKARYPDVQLVSSAGPSPDGERFEKASKRLGELKADFIDEHYYAKPEWFRQNAGRYDTYARTGPKIFAGEYAAQSTGPASGPHRNTWECAISEAAFMTGLERNADVVRMASYAPLLASVDAWQWAPDLIWFDNLRSYGTPSYYVQQLFSRHKGTRVLPVLLPGGAKNGTDSLYVSAVADEPTHEVIVKLVNYSTRPRPVQLALPGLRATGAGQAFVLASSDLQAENSLDQPTRLAPTTAPHPTSGRL